MQTIPTHMAVTDLCDELTAKKLIVNRDYQRSDKVWPAMARSFFIETIVKGFPVPKLALYQITDLKTRTTHKEIVDGQQRSMALLAFVSDELRISPKIGTPELAGKKYSQLDDEYKRRFLTYSLACDLFVGASQAEIREMFRRINAYTVPLNPEEQRHAEYQGAMKWFIHKLSSDLETVLMQLDVVSPKQLVRMQDTKLLADLVYAFIHGIHTTKKEHLNHLYRDRDDDDSFPEEKEVDGRIRNSVKSIQKWKAIHGGALMKMHVFYSLMLAVSHVLKPCTTLQSVHKVSGPRTIDSDTAVGNLTRLADVLTKDEDDVATRFKPFWLACSGKTNVQDHRQIRFDWLCRALTGPL